MFNIAYLQLECVHAAVLKTRNPSGQQIEHLLFTSGIVHGIEAGRLNKLVGNDICPSFPERGEARFNDCAGTATNQSAIIAQSAERDSMKVDVEVEYHGPQRQVAGCQYPYGPLATSAAELEGAAATPPSPTGAQG